MAVSVGTAGKTEIKAILFDLDGTLLRVQMSEFIPRYIRGLGDCCADLVKPKKFAKAMLTAIRGLLHYDGDGQVTNEQRVFSTLESHLGVAGDLLRERFQLYRQQGQAELAELVGEIPLAQVIVRECQQLGVPLVLATNPVFPAFMISARLHWGGLEQQPFSHVTSFENSCYCKPHAGYFSEIAAHLGVPEQNCLMVGNDTQHDLAAAAVGMQTFLVDTWVVEREGTEWPCVNRGDHLRLQAFLQSSFG